MTIASCRERTRVSQRALQKESSFPKLTCIDTVSSTEFIPTLQHGLPKHKNVIYSAAFLYAWNELQNKIEGKINIPDSNHDLKLIAQSQSYIGTLSKGEYITDVTHAEDVVAVSAIFKIGLPFKIDMDTVENGLVFGGKHVKAFGMSSYSERVANQIEILYYENDDKFILKILPADSNDEITVAKGFNANTNFDAILQTIKFSIDVAERERGKRRDDGMFILHDGDIVLLPVMKFNYLANYKSIIGAHIFAKNKTLTIEKANQRNAFLIDEHGAKVESEAEMTVSTDSVGPMVTQRAQRDRKLVLNKEFVLFLKKHKASNPYFMMLVSNADIMVPR